MTKFVDVGSEGVASPVPSKVDVDSSFANRWVTRPKQPVFVSEDDGPPNPHDAFKEFHFSAFMISSAPSDRTTHEPLSFFPQMP